VSARAVDEGAVKAVLERYRTAYSTLDANGARGVWPSVDVRALTRAFDQMESQAIRFDRCDVAVSDNRANATCSGDASYVPKVGNRSTRTTSRQWNFELRRNGDRWIISEVQTR
jgi:hypothetical protein